MHHETGSSVWSEKHTMNHWRRIFGNTGYDIWTLIDRAICVAAADFTQDFRLRRDALTERIYTAHLGLDQQDDDVHPRGSDKTNATSGVYAGDEQQEEENQAEPQQILCREIQDDAAREMVRDGPRHDERDLEEALDEWANEGLQIKEAMDILDNLQDRDQPEAEVLTQLYRLQALDMSIELLQKTSIGVVTNSFRKHPSQRVKTFVKGLVSQWKGLVDDYKALVASTEHAMKEDEEQEALALTNGDYDPEMVDQEEGLCPPPLDEGALLAVRTASIEMSQFFDLMDDELSAGSGPSPPTSNNLQDDFGRLPNMRANNDASDRRYHDGSSPVQDNDSRALKGGAKVRKIEKRTPVHDDDFRALKGGARVQKVHKRSPAEEKRSPVQDKDSRPWKSGVKTQKVQNRSPVQDNDSRAYKSDAKVQKPSTFQEKRSPVRKPSGSSITTVSTAKPMNGRPANGYSQQKPSNDFVRKSDARPAGFLPMNSRSSGENGERMSLSRPRSQEEMDVETKFAVAKRKLQEGYQQVNEAKKQRTVQALELTDLPKGGPKSQKFPQPHGKPGQNRGGWTNGRR